MNALTTVRGKWVLAAVAAAAAFFALRADNARLSREAPLAAKAATARAQLGEADRILQAARETGKESDATAAAWRQYCRELPPELAPAAFAKVATANLPEQREGMQTALLTRWAETDGPAATRFAMAHASGQTRIQVLREWAKQDPTAATAWVLAQPEGPERDRELVTALFWLAGKDPQAALAKVSEIGAVQDHQGWLDGHTQASATEEIFYRWAFVDPAGATAAVAKLPTNVMRDAAAAGLANSGGGADLVGVLKWAMQSIDHKEPPRGASTVANSLLWRMEDDDPVSALEWVQQWPEGMARTQGLTTVLERWAEWDAGAAIGQIEDVVAEGPERDKMLEVVVKSWTWQDPGAAAAYVKAMPAGELQDEVAQSFISVWANGDPLLAGDWAMSFPEGPQRTRALMAVMDGWASAEGNDAREDVARWVEGLPAGASRDAAAKALVGNDAAYYPMVVAPVAEGMGDGPAKQAALVQVAKGWLQVNRAEAETWLAGVDLPEEEKAKLLGK